MNPENLSKQDQIYYYHGLILFLADEVGKYDIYEYWLRGHRSIDKLKQYAESLKDQIEKTENENE